MYKLFVIIIVFTVSLSCQQNNSVDALAFHYAPVSEQEIHPTSILYYDNEYHLFYQTNKESTTATSIQVGHAISSDLCHWKEVASQLNTDTSQVLQAATILLDSNNHSNLSPNSNPILLAYNTTLKKDPQSGQESTTQQLLSSTDHGSTWKIEAQLASTEVAIKNAQIFWHNETEKWILTQTAQNQVEIYTSTNLLTWNLASKFGKTDDSHTNTWEKCELFSLPVYGQDDNQWVLTVALTEGAPNGGSATKYYIGDFDGENFTTTVVKDKWIDYGSDNKLMLTTTSANPTKRVAIGQLTNSLYSQQIKTNRPQNIFTLPRQLHLIQSHGEYLLITQPAAEIQDLKSTAQSIPTTTIENNFELTTKIQYPLELNLTFNTKSSTSLNFAQRFGVNLINTNKESIQIGYDNVNKLFYIDRTQIGLNKLPTSFNQIYFTPYINNDSTLNMKLIIDHQSIELFAKDGLVVMSTQLIPTTPFTTLNLFSKHGKVDVQKGSLKYFR